MCLIKHAKKKMTHRNWSFIVDVRCVPEEFKVPTTRLVFIRTRQFEFFHEIATKLFEILTKTRTTSFLSLGVRRDL